MHSTTTGQTLNAHDLGRRHNSAKMWVSQCMCVMCVRVRLCVMRGETVSWLLESRHENRAWQKKIKQTHPTLDLWLCVIAFYRLFQRFSNRRANTARVLQSGWCVLIQPTHSRRNNSSNKFMKKIKALHSEHKQFECDIYIYSYMVSTTGENQEPEQRASLIRGGDTTRRRFTIGARRTRTRARDRELEFA